jgi:predicted glycosyltransferase
MNKGQDIRSDNAVLPLVLVTVGSSNDEFEALQSHLDTVAQDSAPKYQSLIVTRTDLPKMFYNVLCARVRTLPNVHIRRLGAKGNDCEELLHETGTFLANRKRSLEEE